LLAEFKTENVVFPLLIITMILFMTIPTKPRFLIKKYSEESNVNDENMSLPRDDSSPNHCLDDIIPG